LDQGHGRRELGRSLLGGGDAHAQGTNAQVVVTGAAFIPGRVEGDRPPPLPVLLLYPPSTGGIVIEVLQDVACVPRTALLMR
jgi:hypothetical protein